MLWVSVCSSHGINHYVVISAGNAIKNSLHCITTWKIIFLIIQWIQFFTFDGDSSHSSLVLYLELKIDRPKDYSELLILCNACNILYTDYGFIHFKSYRIVVVVAYLVNTIVIELQSKYIGIFNLNNCYYVLWLVH